MSAFTVTRNIW